MDQTSPEPRRIATPRWLDVRLVLGVVLVLVAVLAGAVVVSRASDTHPVVTATRAMAAGTVLRAGDLAVTQVQLPDDGVGVYVTKMSDAVGRTLSRPVSRGEIVPTGAVRAGSAGTTVALPLSAGSAPTLHKGHRIEVWISTKSCASVILLRDVVVQDVRTDTGSFGSGSGGQTVVISVPADQGQRVAAAISIDQAQIRAGILSGPQPASSAAPPAAIGPGGLPADLAACVSSSPTGP